MKVCVIEKQWFGGAAVWDGALASKTMWQLSRRSKGFRELLLDTHSGLDYRCGLCALRFCLGCILPLASFYDNMHIPPRSLCLLSLPHRRRRMYLLQS